MYNARLPEADVAYQIFASIRNKRANLSHLIVMCGYSQGNASVDMSVTDVHHMPALIAL
jgi:hypothetical protein